MNPSNLVFVYAVIIHLVLFECRSMDVSDLIRRFSPTLGVPEVEVKRLCTAALRMLSTLKPKQSSQSYTGGRHPAGICGALLYKAAKQEGQVLTCILP